MKNEYIQIEEPIQLSGKRCANCGSFWAVESRVVIFARCPVCAGKNIDEAEERVCKAERAVAALRGALKRAKRRKG